MPLFRSGSTRSTLSVFQHRATRYQRYLTLINVFLLVASTLLIFTGTVLLKFYHLGKLDFWSIYFWITPVFMVMLGVYMFVVSVYGFLIAGSENRGLIASCAFFLTIAFLAQLGSIFTALEMRTRVSQSSVGAIDVVKDLNQYGIDSAITAKWDELQRMLHCCGGNNFLVGYTDYRTTPIGNNYSVPDSCCHTPGRGCGQNIFKNNENAIRNVIFVDGCLTILRTWLEDDIIPLVIVYAVIGVVLALIELITVVLASAYVAQITRRINRSGENWRMADAGMPLNSEPDAGRASSNHETVC